jgi:hypothetical protein
LGVVCFAAAGNDARDVYGPDGTFGTNDDTWPAYFPEVAAIACMADTDGRPGGMGGNTVFGGYPDDSFAGFSNYSTAVVPDNPVNSPGAAIDLLMPGVDIYSTFFGGGYSTDSGTSLSSPLAAGLAALHIAENDRATNATGVYAIRQALIDGGIQQAELRGLSVQNDPDLNKEPIGFCPASNATVKGVPKWWLAQFDDHGTNWTHDLAYYATHDFDGDGIGTDREYLGSTDPTDGSHHLRLTPSVTPAGDYTLEWPGAFVDPALPPFHVLRGTSLLQRASGWPQLGVVPRTNGTHRYADTAPPTGSPAYYTVVGTD